MTKIYGLVLTDNSWRVNTYGIVGDSHAQGNDSLNYYAPGAQVLGNAFAGGLAKNYPTGNDFPTVAQWLADFTSVGTGELPARADQPVEERRADGTDIGVNYTTLNAALAGACGAATTAAAAAASTERIDALHRLADRAARHGAVRELRQRRGGHRVLRHDGRQQRRRVSQQRGRHQGGDRYRRRLSGRLDAGPRVAELHGHRGGGRHLRHRRPRRVERRGRHVPPRSDGADITGAIAVPNTGGWQTWTTITKTGVTLAAGTQVMRVVMDTIGPSGSVANFNWFAVR